MSTDAEMWKAVREAQRSARGARYQHEVMLISAHPELTVLELFNNGQHWRLRNRHGLVCDLWPSTGKWRVVGEDAVRVGGVQVLCAHNQPSPPRPPSLPDRVRALRKVADDTAALFYNQAITDVLALFTPRKGQEVGNGES